MRAFAGAWLIAVALLAADPCWAGPARAGKPGGHISVMTQNVYIGTDILALAESTTVCGLLRAAGDALDQVEANDFSQRAMALAALLALPRAVLLGTLLFVAALLAKARS